jgi:hypothetical protein
VVFAVVNLLLLGTAERSKPLLKSVEGSLSIAYDLLEGGLNAHGFAS